MFEETTLPPLTFYTACDVMHNSSHAHSTINKLSLDLTLIYRGTLVYYGSSVTLTLAQNMRGGGQKDHIYYKTTRGGGSVEKTTPIEKTQGGGGVKSI